METNFEKIQRNTQTNFSILLKFSIDILMIFVPSIGYFFQALKFKQTKSSKGFSKTLCLFLLLANILRIFFWLGKDFSITLLYQSIVVIISQIYLIHYYLKYQENSKKGKIPEKSIISHIKNWRDIFNPYKIWDWDYEMDYYKFIIVLFFTFFILCNLVVGNKYTKFYDIIGTVSVSIETFIEIPQIKENCKTKNTKNLSGAMVIMWLLGDLFKTIYNIIYHSPKQMILGGIIQNCEDIILSTQVIIYGDFGPIKKMIRNKYKYMNLNDKEKNGEINNKIDFDIENNTRDNMGTLKISKDIPSSKVSISTKKDEFEDEEDINIDTNI